MNNFYRIVVFFYFLFLINVFLKKKSLIALIFICLLKLNTNAQNLNLAWANKIGGGNRDIGFSVKADASGNIYTTGSFSGTADFDPGAGVFNMTSYGNNDIFISKLDASGNFIWAKQLGGLDNDIGFSLVIDNAGDIIIAGYFKGTADFDPGAGIFNMTSAGQFDYFVVKLDPTGNFIWAKQIGNANDEAQDFIGTDLNGNIYLNGKFSGTVDFDPGSGVYNLTSTITGFNVFILKLDPAGNFLWVDQFTGDQTVSSFFFVADNGDNYIIGQFDNTVDFDPGSSVYNFTAISGSTDAFIAKLDASGNFKWAKQFASNSSGSWGGIQCGLTVDANGNIYATGHFKGTFDFDPGPGVFNLTSSTYNEVFILKLDTNGNLIWANHIATAQGTPTTGTSAQCSIATDASGNVYSVGSFINTIDFDPGPGVYNLTSSGGWDIFISTLDNAGNFINAQKQGGTGDDYVTKITSIGNGDFIATGGFSLIAAFDPCPGSSNLSSSGNLDIYVEKFASPAVNISASSISICSGTSVTFTATPTYGGSAPSYQWQLNGVNIGTDSPTFTTATLNNNDQVNVILTSNAFCVPPVIATSNVITVAVASVTPASVSISATATAVCQGTPVTFTATPINGGGTPVYQWQVNGLNVGTNSSTYTAGNLSNGDEIKVVMTPGTTCATPLLPVSNTIIMTVSPGGQAIVNINATSSIICIGGSVTFTATPTNGGSSAFYQWQVNGVNAGTNSVTYTTNTLVNGDVVRVIMTSGLACATGSPVSSNSIMMIVSPSGTSSVNISATSSTICSGTSVTFAAVPVNGGSAPVYQWKINGSNAGTNSSTFTTASLMNGDVVQVVMASNLSCATGSPVTSNSIVMNVTQPLTPSISIGTTSSTICAGTNVTFTANPTNSGTSPIYQWQLNGVNVGANNPFYTNNTLSNGDILRCILISNYACVTNTTVTSNAIQMTVNAAVSPSISIAASANNICMGTLVTFTATALNGGVNPIYQWKSNGINVGVNSPTYSTNSILNGDLISCSLTNVNSCNANITANSNSIAMVVSATAAPQLTITSTANNICPNTNVIFTAMPLNVGTAVTYQWQLNGISIAGNNLTYASNSLKNGDKIDCIMSTFQSCSNTSLVYSNIITMIVKPKPVISFIPSNPVISFGSSIQLNASITGNVITYLWTPSAGLSNPTISNPMANPMTTTTYNLKVIEDNSCVTDQKITITVLKDIYIPNTFTPNGDTKNDLFRIPYGTSLNLEYFIIYDRYGNEVFKTRNINIGWDGFYKGQKSPDGAYTYLIKGSDSKGKIFIKGTVLLIR